MPHSIRKRRVTFIGSRVILILLALCLVVPFCEFSTYADEITVVVDTERKPIEGHPIYVIAVPRQEKLPPRPLNIPIISSRPAADAMLPADPQLLFDMTGPQLVKIGNGLLDDAEYQMALLYFQEAQKKDGNTPDIQRGLAHCYYGLKRDEESLVLYKEVIAQNPAFWPAQFHVGRIHLERGRYAEAVEALTNAVKLKPEDPQTMTALGIALTRNGRGDAAIPYLTRVAALDRYDKEAFYNLGEAYEADRQWLKAAETFKFGADGRGDDPNGYFYWGVMLFNGDQVVEAFDAFQKVRAIDVTAKHAGAAFYMAEIYRLRGKLQDALGQYQVVLKLKPDDTESLFQAGYLSFKLGQVDPAKDLFKKLIDVNPLHAGGAANWAAIEARFNEIRRSRKEKTPGITLREVAQANPDSVEAHINLGAQLITEEVYPEAVTVLQRAVNLRPNSASAQYNFGLALFKTGDYERSVTASAKALELKPNWADAYNNLGLAYAGLKRWEEAARAYREAVRIVPNYAGAYFNLGIAVLRMGQVDLAEQLVEKLKPMDWAHQARLAHEIHAVKRPGASLLVASTQVTPVVTQVTVPAATQASVPAGPTNNTVAAPPENKATTVDSSPSPPPASSSNGNVASPTPTPPPAPTSAPLSTPPSAPAEVECPEPIYRRSGVTQMASIVGPIEVPYTDEAIQNNAEGQIILVVVLCGNGRVSEITVKKGLSFGLTERAIEAMRKIQFQPAVKDSQPVTVIAEQAFTCAGRVCTAVTSP